MYQVKVGMATCGMSAGAKATYGQLGELLELSTNAAKAELSIRRMLELG